MIEVRKIGWSSFNQAVCGLRFLFRTTSPKPWPVAMIPFGKRPKRLPAVLSGAEVNKLLSCVKCHKHRMFLLVQYAAGMRLNEAAHLKISDIDSQRMQLRIGNGKGQKTRIVPMAPRLLSELREYWKVYRPSDYLFPGKTPDVPLQPTTIQKMCKVAAKEAGHFEERDAAHAETFLRDRTFGSRRRSADDQSSAGTREFLDDDDLSARQNLCIWGQPRVPSTGCRCFSCRAGCSRRTTTTLRRLRKSFRSAATVHCRVCDIIIVGRPCRQVQSTLAKLELCRTDALGGHLYRCDPCDFECRVNNSCGDRHCPQCAGAKRADWLDSTSQLLLPGITYFQVVFTIPDKLSSLALGNREEMYDLLFRAAWKTLKDVIADEQLFEAAAVMVLHTWNQMLEAHAHVTRDGARRWTSADR